MFIIKYLKSFLYILISILLLSIFIGTFSYFNILGDNAIKIFEILAIIISMIIGGLYVGKNSTQRGYIEGIKIGIITIIFLFIFNYLAYDNTVTISTLFFYIVIILSSVLGSILGINKKSSN